MPSSMLRSLVVLLLNVATSNSYRSAIRMKNDFTSAGSNGAGLTRRQVLDKVSGLPLILSGPVLLSSGGPAAAFAEGRLTDAVITDRVRIGFHLAETQSSVEGRPGLPPEDMAVVVGLYGKEAPKTVANFLKYCRPSRAINEYGEEEIRPGGLVKTLAFRLEPGVSVEIGRPKSSAPTKLSRADQAFLDAGPSSSRSPPPEVNEARTHNVRGLLTHRPTNLGPNFEVLLAPAPTLDEPGKGAVFGEVLFSEGQGRELLAALEEAPVYSYNAAEGSGAVADAVFQAQKKFYTDMAKNLGDTRFEDRRGMLLRKVDVRSVEIIP